jgi:hypothetical protein
MADKGFDYFDGVTNDYSGISDFLSKLWANRGKNTEHQLSNLSDD